MWRARHAPRLEATSDRWWQHRYATVMYAARRPSFLRFALAIVIVGFVLPWAIIIFGVLGVTLWHILFE